MVKRTTELPPWWELAANTLNAAVAQTDQDRIGALLTEIGEKFGDQWPQILYTMIDTMMSAQGISPADYGPKLTQINDVDGEPENAEVLDAIGWSSALIQARVTDDSAAYFDLIAQINSDEMAALYIGNLVNSLGITIRAISTGYLPSGRTHIQLPTTPPRGGIHEG